MQSSNQHPPESVLDTFHRDGVAIVRAVLTREECHNLVELSARFLDDNAADPNHVHGVFDKMMIIRYAQALDPAFAALLVKEPLYSLVEAILGPSPVACGMNSLRSLPGEGIAVWHVDDTVEFPVADGLQRHAPEERMPVHWLTVQIALTDILSPEDGPTEYVPGSHYSGRNVPTEGDMAFEGRGPRPLLVHAGDAYLFNHQVWHRGSPVRSSTTRYLMQVQYAQRWLHARFSDPANTRPYPGFDPQAADPRLRRALGMSS